jgi:membrane protein YqaA with SNARE-associated domain
VFAVFAAAAAVAGPIFLYKSFDFDPVMVHRAGYAALFVMGVLGGVTLFLPVPMLPLVFAGAGVLDPVGVAFAAAGGMTVGMLVTYFVGTLGSSFMTRIMESRKGRFGQMTQKSSAWFTKSGVQSSFFLAAIPNPIYDFAGLIAGSLRVPVQKFCLGTFVGKSCQTLTVAFAGFYAAGRIPGL